MKEVVRIQNSSTLLFLKNTTYTQLKHLTTIVLPNTANITQTYIKKWGLTTGSLSKHHVYLSGNHINIHLLDLSRLLEYNFLNLLLFGERNNG